MPEWLPGHDKNDGQAEASNVSLHAMAKQRQRIDKGRFSRSEIAKKGGEMWKSMNGKDKGLWEEKAAKAKEQYAKDLESYNANGGGGDEGGKKATKRGKKGKKPAPAKSKKKKEESEDEDGDDAEEDEESE